jgi:hypothetical protein
MSSEPASPSRLDTCYLGEFVPTETDSEYEVAVLAGDLSDPYERMVGKLFDRQPVDVVESVDISTDEDSVALLSGDEVIAVSPLSALSDTILMVNSDLYMTGAVGLDDIELPDVIEALSDTTFHARGYPESNYEKLPLILISRYIERLSAEHGGVHRASFQRLSRMRDERGTKNVYKKLAANGATVHAYGVPDWIPPREMGLSVHAGYGGDWDHSWFVLHRSPDAAAALVAIETGVNEWQSRWTFDRSLVLDIEDQITEFL